MKPPSDFRRQPEVKGLPSGKEKKQKPMITALIKGEKPYTDFRPPSTTQCSQRLFSCTVIVLSRAFHTCTSR